MVDGVDGVDLLSTLTTECARLGSLEMNQAFAALRRYSRDYNERLSDVAGRVVSRQLGGQAVIDHAQSKEELSRS